MRGNGNTTELAVVEERPSSVVMSESQMGFADMREMATEISKSGCFRSGNKPLSPQEVLVLMMIARARGIPMIDGMLQFDIIDGRPAIKAKSLLARFQAAGGRVKWLETTDEVCRAEFWHPAHHPEHMVVIREYKDFEVKGLTKGYEGKIKKNWRESPMQMLMARAETLAINAILPGVAMGIPVSEEVEVSEVTATSNPIQARLNEQLKATLAHPQPNPPIEAKTAPPEPARAEQPKASTDWGKYIATSVERYNLAASKLSDDTKLRISVHQVANHIAKISVGSQDDLKTNGKHDGKKVSAVLSRTWHENSQDVMDLADQYLDAKLAEIAPATESADEPDGEPVEAGDGEWKEGRE